MHVTCCGSDVAMPHQFSHKHNIAAERLACPSQRCAGPHTASAPSIILRADPRKWTGDIWPEAPRFRSLRWKSPFRLLVFHRTSNATLSRSLIGIEPSVIPELSPADCRCAGSRSSHAPSAGLPLPGCASRRRASRAIRHSTAAAAT